MFPNPLLVGVSEEPYSWRNFAQLLLGQSEVCLPEDELPRIDVQGETGIRAYILELAYIQDQAKTTWLLEQTDDDLEALESQLPSLVEEECLEFLDSFILWMKRHAAGPQLGQLRAVFTPDVPSRNIEAIYKKMTQTSKQQD